MEKKDYRIFFVIAGFYLFIEMLGITCPIKYVTGISCAGCGMSRAILSLAKLDFHSAFHYHPLFFIPFVFVIVYLLRKKISKNVFKITCIAMASLMLSVWILRLVAGGQDIVVFHPSENIISRILNLLS